MVHSGGGGGFIGKDISVSPLCLLSRVFVICFKMSLWSQPFAIRIYSHVATKRTAAKILFTLGEEGKGRKLERVGGARRRGVWRLVVAVIIIIITVIVYLWSGWNREDCT